MCWKITKKDFDKNPEKYHRVADKDIVVYKFGNRTDNNFNPIFVNTFSYSVNVLNKEVKLVLEETDEFFGGIRKIINEGYHSYAKEYFIFKRWVSHGLSEVVAIRKCDTVEKFIIPKGTEYYENPFGEIVSSNIIWTGEKSNISKQNNMKCVGK